MCECVSGEERDSDSDSDSDRQAGRQAGRQAVNTDSAGTTGRRGSRFASLAATFTTSILTDFFISQNSRGNLRAASYLVK